MDFLEVPLLIAGNGSFGINTNVFETNLINQLILIAGLVVLGGDALGTSLAERQDEIIKNVEDMGFRYYNFILEYKEDDEDITYSVDLVVRSSEETTDRYILPNYAIINSHLKQNYKAYEVTKPFQKNVKDKITEFVLDIK